MQCASCGTFNPAQARFCMGCGISLINGIVCSNCQTLLPPQARYCFYCGAVQVLPGTPCPQCGTSVAPGMAYCPACGRQLSQTSASIPQQTSAAIRPGASPHTADTPAADPASEPVSLSNRLTSLRLYLPDALYKPFERSPNEEQLVLACTHLSKLLSTTKTYLPWPVVVSPQPPGEPAGGMVQGTFLLADMSGFTALSERLSKFGQAGAEQITAIINELFQVIVSILYDHGGTLLKFGGDALLGVFMAESDTEMAEGALRALQAASAMQKGMEKFATLQIEQDTYSLRIKCGISSGRYFAAHIGTPQSMAYVTTGHTVNRSDQAQNYCEPGEIVIARSTLDLVKDQVETEPREDDFYVVRHVPAVEEKIKSLVMDEPPDGTVIEQIVYLLNRLDRLGPYLPAELISRLVNNPTDIHITPDHRPVTMMFANYVGVSDLIEDLGDSQPDLITHHLNDYFVQMAEIVERYEGTVARMDQYTVGDRLIIFFGAPRAHEDDPVRAVYTALEMEETTRKQFAALQTPTGVYRFRQRIGINTGHLFAGNCGAADLRQEYTLMGDDINMAARLMSKSDWGKIFISQKTRDRVAPFFNLVDQGELAVKGKRVPIRTYQVLGRSEQVGRTRGLNTGTSPFIGRSDEMQTLQNCVQGLLNGRGQIVSIYGDSGLGKSRLVQEMRETLPDQQQVLWIDGRALSFSEQVSYWLAVQMMRSVLNLPPDASTDDVLFTLWERGEEVMGKEQAREAVPFLANMMGLKLEGEWDAWIKKLSPEVRQKQTFWAAREFFSAVARQRPTIIALDDLHWADEASLALIEDLLDVTVQASVMFCLIFRQMRDKGCWRLRDKAVSQYPHRHTDVLLQPLNADQGSELLSKLLPGAEFSPESQRVIFDKSSGNPFYLEEIVRTLLESGVVEADHERSDPWRVTAGIEKLHVPDTLQGAILARIDRLAEDVRQALQIASVIGRTFELRVLHYLTHTNTELGQWLAQLERDDLIRPLQRTISSAYMFSNALVQEVAYDNLLVQRRQEYHRRVGDALEQILAERIGNQSDNLAIDLDGDGIPEQGSELLAYHFRLSDDPERAIIYLERAAKKAQAEFANTTAIQLYTHLLDLLGEQEEIWEKRFDILSRRQQIYKLVGQKNARTADLNLMLAMADERQDRSRRASTLQKLADLYDMTSQYSEAEKMASEALAIWNELGSQEGQAASFYQLGVLAYYHGDYANARSLLEQAIELQKAIGDTEGEAWSTMYRGMIAFVHGEYSDAAQDHGYALELAQKRQDHFQAGIHLTNSARVSMGLGQYEQALSQFQEALEMKIRVGDRMGQGFNLFGIGIAQMYLEHYGESEVALQASLTLREQLADQRGVSYCWHGLGLLSLTRSQFGPAKDYLQKAYEMRSRLNLKAEVIEDLSYLGQAYLGAGQLEEALNVSNQAVTLLAEQRDVPGEEQAVSFNHYRILNAYQDPAAVQFLQQAYDTMLCQARLIKNLSQRELFLTHVRVNCEIMTEIEKWSGVIVLDPGEASA